MKFCPLGWLLILLGAFLLVVSLYGETRSLWNPEIVNTPTFFEDDVTLSRDELLDSLIRREESDSAFVTRVCLAVNRGIAHHWENDSLGTFALRIPIWENWLLWGAAWFNSDHFTKYEIYDSKKAIERGFGLCSQHALIVAQALERGGVESRLHGLAGHVVADAMIDGSWWIADADYGVVMPLSIEQLEDNPDTAIPYYSQAGVDSTEAVRICTFYDRDRNRLYAGAEAYHEHEGFETVSYWLKWPLPVLFMLIGVKLRRMRARRT